jgi:hypothetical protein
MPLDGLFDALQFLNIKNLKYGKCGRLILYQGKVEICVNVYYAQKCIPEPYSISCSFY